MLSLGVYAASLLFIAFLVYGRRRRSWSSKGVNLPPGSKGLPFIGEALHLLFPSHSLDLPPFIKSRFLRYGPIFQTRLIGRRVVVSADRNLNRLILQHEGKLAEFWCMDTLSEVFSIEGEGRLSSSGDIHKYYRGLTLKHFGAEALKNRLLNQVQDMVSEMVQNWSTQESVEVKQSVLDVSTNFAANFLFGYDEDKAHKKLGEKLGFILECLFSFPINVPGTNHHKCLKYKEEIMNMIRVALKGRLDSPGSRRGDLMDHALEDLNTRDFLTDEFIVKLTFALLFASSEFISLFTAIVLKFLSENPLALDELMVEHERFLENREDPGSQLTWNEVKSMTFTLNVVNESLRLGNIAFGLVRKVIKDIEFKGYTIPAGWIILMVTSACNYDSNIYTDPLTFNPWRWKDLASDVVSNNFMPFGGGTKQCAGAEFVRVYMITLLHVLVTKYRWTKVKGGKISRTPMLKMKNGFHIKVIKRE